MKRETGQAFAGGHAASRAPGERAHAAIRHSGLFTGRIRHRRHLPRTHEFTYRLFMVYLDLDEIDAVFALSRLWSRDRRNLAELRRSDYLAPGNVPLRTAVLDRIEAATGNRPDGAVRMLTHLRYFGYCFNPVTFYYAYQDEALHTIVAEITNTPWKERHAYVLPVAEADRGPGLYSFELGKAFHVSPFLGMDLGYRWRFSDPGRRLFVHMDVRGPEQQFDATLNLERSPITAAALRRALIRFPLMTARVTAAIHWQALKLWLKRVPVFDHPGKGGGQ